MTEEQKARLDRLLSDGGWGRSAPEPGEHAAIWRALFEAGGMIAELRVELAELRERVRGLEANSDLVGDAVDELIAEREGDEA